MFRQGSARSCASPTPSLRFTAPTIDDASDKTFVDSLVAIFNCAHGLVSDQFGNESGIGKAVREAFEHVLNLEPPAACRLSTAELLPLAVDRLLKSEGSEGDVDRAALVFVRLFTHLNDKDVVGDVLRARLAKRLLSAKTSSDLVSE